MPNYEVKRLGDCFERLKLLQNEMSCLAIKVDAEQCSNTELVKSTIYCELAAELRGIVLRYRPDLDELADDAPSRLDRCVSWACAAFGGTGATQ